MSGRFRITFPGGHFSTDDLRSAVSFCESPASYHPSLRDADDICAGIRSFIGSLDVFSEKGGSATANRVEIAVQSIGSKRSYR